jgi:hypothetical protein
MLKYKVINADENIDRKLSFHLQRNKDTEKALIYGIANLKNFNSKSGISFETLTYLAVNYFNEHVNVCCEDGKLKENKLTTIAAIKAVLDACNYTQYTPIETLQNAEYAELCNAKCYTKCYLIIQTAYFFGSNRFGDHPYIESIEHYRETGQVLQNNIDIELLKGGFDKVDNYKSWQKNPAKFKKKPFQFNKDTYLNNWYYGTLDIIANTFGSCKHYKYEFPLKNDGTISEYRIYNKFIQTSRILREVQPFEMFEFDVKSGHLSYIDLHVGSNVAKTAYENYAKEKGCTRDEAKRKFQTILNLRDRRNSYKSKEEYIKTLCGFGWTIEQAKQILTEVTDSERYLFGRWATKREEKCVSEFAETNNLIGWTRGHDAVYGLRKKDIDYKSFCTSFQNGIIQFELKEVGIQQNECTVLPKHLETKKGNNIIPTSSFDDKLNQIKMELDKFTRIKAPVLEGFLSEKIPELKAFYSTKHINLLVSPASSGKTSMVTKIKEGGSRCLLIVPTQAIIKNKKLDGFIQVFGTTDIQKQINTAGSIIGTFDKASQIKTEDFDMFDYILIDESHLLFTERYRIDVIVLLLKKIKSYTIKARDVAQKHTKSATIILMTGTPTGEELYFGLDENNVAITQKKEFINNKDRKATLVFCEEKDSCYTSFITQVAKLMKIGHRVLIPTNMGEKWINCVVAALGNPTFAIYSNNQKNSADSEEINKRSMIRPEVVLIFTTSLGNVGIDINNTDMSTTMVVYTDNQNRTTGQMIEQYANRFRKIDVEVFVFCIMPKQIISCKEFSFNYVENANDINLIKNDIATPLFADEEYANMMNGTTVDREKVMWKTLNQQLEEHNSNIIYIGGYLKTMGYKVDINKGNPVDISLIKKFKGLFEEQKQLEHECKIRALDFMLSDIPNLQLNINNRKIETGENSLVGKTLTLENEQIFRIIRRLVKKFLKFTSNNTHYKWIKGLMIEEKMNFRQINNCLKLMDFVNSDNNNELDLKLIQDVDQVINFKKGTGSLSITQYQNMLDDLAPTYTNRAYIDADYKTKEKIRASLVKKISICYEIKRTKKDVTFRQLKTHVWISEGVQWYRDLMGYNETEANESLLIARNQKLEAIAMANSKPTPSTVGKAYEHITNDVIDIIHEKIKMDGFINVATLIQLTGLTKSSVGQFVTYKLPDLKSKPKMIGGIRETRYYP